MTSRAKFNLIAILIILCWATLVYSNTFNNSFHYDDYEVIVNNSLIRKASNFIHFPGLMERLGEFRPLAYLSFALNYYYGGLDVYGYHIVNLLIHLIVCILVYAIVGKLLFKTEGCPSSQPVSLLPLFSALLFATHPINTQSVNYISSRSFSLAILFYLLSLYLFLRFLDHRSTIHKPKSVIHTIYYICSFASYMLALLSREIAITLPLTLILADLFFYNSTSGTAYLSSNKPRGNILKEKNEDSYSASLRNVKLLAARFRLYHVPYWLIIILGLIRLSKPDTIVPLSTNLLMACKAYVYYLQLIFLPTGLSIDHFFPSSSHLLQSTSSWGQIFDFISIFIVILLIAIGFLIYKWEKILSFCIFLYLIGPVPTSSTILTNPGSLYTMIAEHRIYSSGIGFNIFLGMLIIGVSRFIERRVNYRKRATFMAIRQPKYMPTYYKNYLIQCSLILLILISYSVITFKRNYDWKDEISLWSKAIALYPDDPGAEYNRFKAIKQMGIAYLQKGDIDKAIERFNRAIGIKYDDVKVHNNLGFALARKGLFDESIKAYEDALKIEPDSAITHNNIGVSYKEKGRLDESINSFKKAIQLNNNYGPGHFNLAVSYEEKGFLDEAIMEYKESLRLKPDNILAMYRLGNILLNKGSLDEAISMFSELLQVSALERFDSLDIDKTEGSFSVLNEQIRKDKTYLQFHSLNKLGIVFLQMGKIDDAIKRFHLAINYRYDDANVHNNLGYAYYKKGMFYEAEDEFKISLRLDPNLAEAHNSLGVIYFSIGAYENAVREFKETIRLRPEHIEAHKNLDLMKKMARLQ